MCQLRQITTTVQEKVAKEAEEEEAEEVVVVVIRVVRFCREAPPPPPLALPLREREREREREMIYCHSCRDLVVYTDLLPLRRHLLLLLPSTSVCILHHMIL